MASAPITSHSGLAPWRQSHNGLAPARLRALQREHTCCRAQASLSNTLASTSGSTSRQQQTAIVAIDPTTASAPQTRGGPSLPIVGVALGAVAALAFVANKLRNKGVDSNTSRYSVNMHLANVMKDVNTVRIDDLSPDQIEAARARRSKERANHKLSLEEIDLPQNHPFATKQALSKEEQEQSLQNLRARSMRRRNFDAMQGGDDGTRTGPGAIGRRR